MSGQLEIEVGAECLVPLPDGKTLNLTLEQAGELWERMPEIYNEGRQKRAERQASLADPASRGLVPVVTSGGQVDFTLWTVPEPIGLWPVGVPLLKFTDLHRIVSRNGIPIINWQEQDKKSHEPPRWSLIFSRAPTVSLMDCQWDDLEGFSRLAKALTGTSVETLATQFMLNADDERRLDLNADSEGICSSARRLLEMGTVVPPLDVSLYKGKINKAITLSQATVFDPETFRYVIIPGILLAAGGANTTLPQVDRALSKVGLISVKGFSTQGWGDIQRLAVKKGFGRRAGKIDSGSWQVLGLDSKSQQVQNGSPHFSISWFHEALVKSLGIVKTEPLSWDEWVALREVQS